MAIHPSFYEPTERIQKSSRGYLACQHSFIFHREYFESGDGAPQRGEYEALRGRLSKGQNEELVHLLTMNPQSGELGTRHFLQMANDRAIDPAIRNLDALPCTRYQR